MSASLSSPAPVLSTVLSASQITTLSTSVVALLQGKNAAEILAQLPAVLLQLYNQLGLLYTSTATNQQAVLVQLIEYIVGLVPGLSAGDAAIIDSVVSNLVPALVTLLPKLETAAAAAAEDAEAEAKTCWQWFVSLFSCC